MTTDNGFVRQFPGPGAKGGPPPPGTLPGHRGLGPPAFDPSRLRTPVVEGPDIGPLAAGPDITKEHRERLNRLYGDVVNANESYRTVAASTGTLAQSMMNRQSDLTQARGIRDLLGAGAGLSLGLDATAVAALFAPEESRRQEAQLGAEMEVAIDVLQRTSWRFQVGMVFPLLLSSGTVKTADELIDIVQYNRMNIEDRTFLTDLFDEFKTQQASDMPPEELISLLSKPGGSLSDFLDLSFQTQTVEEVLDAFAEAGRFVLPEGQTPESIREALLELGYNTDDVDQVILDDVARAKEIKIAFDERNLYWDVIRKDAQELKKGEITGAIAKAKVMQQFQQPALMMVKPAEWWVEKVIHPIVGIGAYALEYYLSRMPGAKESHNEDFRRMVSDFRAEGDNIWMALGHAFDEQEMNGGVKFALEVMFDPLSYFGFGLYSKLFFFSAKASRFILKAEMMYLKAADIPFRGLKHVWTQGIEIGGRVYKAPKTLGRKGLDYGGEVTGAVRYHLEKTTGKSLHNIHPMEARDILVAAVGDAIRNPQGVSDAHKVGRTLLMRKVISKADVVELKQAAGIFGFDESQVSVELLEALNTIIESTSGVGWSKLLNVKESASLIVRLLELGDAKGIPAVITWMDRGLAELKSNVVRMTDFPNIRKVMEEIGTKATKNFMDTERSLIANKRIQGGWQAAAVNHKVYKGLTSAVFTIDRFVTLPFARMYLLFAAYAPFNILENAGKTIMAGGNPFYRGDPARKVAVYLHGISGGDIPMDVYTHGAFVPMAGEAFPSQTANALGDMSQMEQFSSARRKILEDELSTGLESWLNLRGLRKWSGFDLGAEIGGSQRAHYYIQMYKKGMQERVPKIVGLLVDIVDQHTKDFNRVMSREIAETYREEITARLMTGDMRMVNNIVTDFTPDAQMGGRVGEIFDQYPQIGPWVGDFVVNEAINGTLWSAGPNGIKKLFETTLKRELFERFLISPAHYVARYKEIVETMLEWVPKTRSELNFKMNAIEQTVETFGDIISVSLEAAHRMGSTIVNPNVKDEWYKTFWDVRVTPHLNQGAQLMQTVGDDLIKNLPDVGDLTASQRLQYTELMHQYIDGVNLIKDVRGNAGRNRASFFEKTGLNYKAPGKTRDDVFWDNFFRSQDEIYSNMDVEFLRNRSQTARSVSAIEGIKFPEIVDASTTGLTPQHVATLFGVAPSELGRNMYIPELMVIRGKRSFTEKIRTRAEQSARQINKSADELGYTEEAVHDVYDSIMSTLQSDTTSMNANLSPLFGMLDNIRTELIYLGTQRNVLMSDEAVGVAAEAVRKIGNEMKYQPFRSPEQAALLKSVVEPGTKVRTAVQPDAALLATFDDDVTRSSSKLTNLYDEQARAKAIVWDDDRLVKEAGGLNIPDEMIPENLRGLNVDDVVPTLERSFLDSVDEWNSRAAFELKVARAVDSTPAGGSVEWDFLTFMEKESLKANYGRFLTTVDGVPSIDLTKRGNFGRSLLDQIKIDVNRAATKAAGVESQLGQVRNVYDIARTGAINKGKAFERTARDKAIARFTRPLGTARRELDKATKRRDEYASRTVESEIPSPYQQTRIDVAKEIRKSFGMDFPDYSVQSAVGDNMRLIYPFWGYEAHRWAWYLPREALRHPGAYAAWGKYMDNSDNGYIHIPGTDLDVNPLRGTILAGGFRRLTQRDYPEYYDSFPGLSGALDAFSRWGFYPGFPVSVTMAMFGAKVGNPQLGEVLPASAPFGGRTMLNFLSAISPPELVRPLRDIIFPDRFFDYLTATSVSANGKPGMELLAKRVAGDPLSDTEQAWWDAGTRRASRWGMAMEQGAVFRLRPSEKIKVFKEANKIIEFHTGIPVDNLVDMSKNGLRIDQVFGPMPPGLQKALSALEIFGSDGVRQAGWSDFVGGSMALVPSELGKSQAIVKEFWTAIQNEKKLNRNKLVLVEQRMTTGEATMDDWLKKLKDNNTSLINSIESSRKNNPRYNGGVDGDPIALSLEERLAYAEKWDLPLIQFHPTEELRDMMYQVEVKEVFNQETGKYEDDWDTFFLHLEMIEQAAGSEFVEEVRKLADVDRTDLGKTHKLISRTLFKAWNLTYDVVKGTFSEEEQEVIARHRAADNEFERQAYAAVPSSTNPETTVVALFRRQLTEMRTNIREVDPDLDAWLAFFQRVQTVKTPQARERLIEIRSSFNLRTVTEL